MRVFILLAFAFTTSRVVAQGYGRVEYVSPDDQLRAVVIPVHLVDGEFHEHRIEFRDRAGKLFSAPITLPRIMSTVDVYSTPLGRLTRSSSPSAPPAPAVTQLGTSPRTPITVHAMPCFTSTI
jgi:hypothetical protein